MTEIKRTCRGCDEYLSVKDFYKNHPTNCKKCHSKQVIKSRNKNKERYNKYKKEYYHRPENKERRERQRQKAREYYHKNKEKILQRRKEKRAVVV